MIFMKGISLNYTYNDGTKLNIKQSNLEVIVNLMGEIRKYALCKMWQRVRFYYQVLF